MAVAQRKTTSDLGDVRRRIFRATRDPAIAEQVFSLAVASRSPNARTALPWLSHGPLFAAVPAPPQHAGNAVHHLAHDLCVLLAFIGPQQGERAQLVMGPANWRLVQCMGGWRALHEVAPHYRRRHLLRQLVPLLTSVRLGEDLRGGKPLRPARASEAWQLLMDWQRSVPALEALDPEDLVERKLSTGALAFLLGKLAAACGSWPKNKTRQAWLRLAARCPEVGDG